MLQRGFFPFAGLFLIAAIVLLVVGLRSLRRTAGPMAEVMEGVGRVADGDLGARVTPRGRGDGSITVSARAEGTPEGQAIELSVIDSGPGIADELLPYVFDRFVKCADSDGSGLGLAIARSLVEAHGGSISARVPLSGGTKFSVILPAHR